MIKLEKLPEGSHDNGGSYDFSMKEQTAKLLEEAWESRKVTFPDTVHSLNLPVRCALHQEWLLQRRHGCS